MSLKAVALISGGIDSPVAASLMNRRMEVIPLHFCLYPFYCEFSLELAVSTIKFLKDKRIVNFNTLVLCPWGKFLSTILKSYGRGRYMCLLCRRAMFKLAERVCDAQGAMAIITGESLGQKASQTIDNLAITSYGVKYPILRPLIGLNKDEVQRLSKELGMYPEKHVGCCTATPKHPVTKGKVDTLNKLYESLRIERVVNDRFKESLVVKSKDLGRLDEVARGLLT